MKGYVTHNSWCQFVTSSYFTSPCVPGRRDTVKLSVAPIRTELTGNCAILSAILRGNCFTYSLCYRSQHFKITNYYLEVVL